MIAFTRVFRIVDLGDSAATELYGERVEQDPIISDETVYRRIYNTSLIAMIDFVFDLAPGEGPPRYDELLAEMQRLDPRVRAIRLERVAMTSDVHICDEECRYFGVPDHLAQAEAASG